MTKATETRSYSFSQGEHDLRSAVVDLVCEAAAPGARESYASLLAFGEVDLDLSDPGDAAVARALDRLGAHSEDAGDGYATYYTR